MLKNKPRWSFKTGGAISLYSTVIVQSLYLPNVCAGNTGYGVYSLTLRNSPHRKLFLVRAFSVFRGVLPGSNIFTRCAILRH